MLPAPFSRLPQGTVKTRQLAADGMLFRQGDEVHSIYHVAQGIVHLVRHTKAGRIVPVFKSGTGDTLAEAALFSARYHCDAIAMTNCTIHVMDKPAILAAMAADPIFGADLVRRLAGQVQTYRRRLELLAIASAEDRVLAALADGRLTGTVIDFAAEIGLSHEATYRALAALVRDGRAARPGRGRYIATAKSGAQA